MSADTPSTIAPEEHPFVEKPHRTLFVLAIPVTLSLIAEPVTGLVDTAFVARLGDAPLAALGVGTTALSTVFWIFNFLSISTQTEVAHAMGRQDTRRASEIVSLALIVGAVISLTVMIVFSIWTGVLADLLGAAPEVRGDAITYLRVRLLGAPAVIGTLILLGALRGLQDMRNQLYVAVGVNVINIVLDGPFIMGWGPIPRMEVAGAALASTLAQWAGLLWALSLVLRRLGFVAHVDGDDLRRLFRVGGDLFIRTGMLTLFMLLATRVSNQIGPDAGAAHQAIRTVWLFFSLLLEGLAVTTQSLVGYFIGARRRELGLAAATIALRWSVGVGIGLALLMLASTPLVEALLLPDNAQAIFGIAWLIGALIQPFAGIAFVTDGIHWGTGDYTYLRNGMIMATVSGGVLLLLIDTATANTGAAFAAVWVATGVWVLVRAGVGAVRVWPGIGDSPLRTPTTM